MWRFTDTLMFISQFNFISIDNLWYSISQCRKNFRRNLATIIYHEFSPKISCYIFCIYETSKHTLCPWGLRFIFVTKHNKYNCINYYNTPQIINMHSLCQDTENVKCVKQNGGGIFTEISRVVWSWFLPETRVWIPYIKLPRHDADLARSS